MVFHSLGTVAGVLVHPAQGVLRQRFGEAVFYVAAARQRSFPEVQCLVTSAEVAVEIGEDDKAVGFESLVPGLLESRQRPIEIFKRFVEPSLQVADLSEVDFDVAVKAAMKLKGLGEVVIRGVQLAQLSTNHTEVGVLDAQPGQSAILLIQLDAPFEQAGSIIQLPQEQVGAGEVVPDGRHALLPVALVGEREGLAVQRDRIGLSSMRMRGRQDEQGCSPCCRIAFLSGDGDGCLRAGEPVAHVSSCPEMAAHGVGEQPHRLTRTS